MIATTYQNTITRDTGSINWPDTQEEISDQTLDMINRLRKSPGRFNSIKSGAEKLNKEREDTVIYVPMRTVWK